MCLRRHWLNWSMMLVMAATLFASLPPYRIFLYAEGGLARLSMSYPKASLVIPKEDVDAGKISFRAIVPRGDGCLTGRKVEENQITLVGGTGGCRMNMQWSDRQMLFGKNTAASGVHANYGSSDFVSVDVLENGNVALNKGDEFQSGCNVVSNPNNNTVQGGKVVDFSVENILTTCPDIAIEFDSRYELYRPPGSPNSVIADGKNDKTVLIVCLSLGAVLILLAGIVFGLWCWWKHRANNSMPAALTDVKVVPAKQPKPKEVNNSPDMPKVTAISNTRVKTTQPKPSPEVKPSKAIPKNVPKLEPCPTEETDEPLQKVVISKKKKEKPSTKKAAKKKKDRSQKDEPYPPMHKSTRRRNPLSSLTFPGSTTTKRQPAPARLKSRTRWSAVPSETNVSKSCRSKSRSQRLYLSSECLVFRRIMTTMCVVWKRRRSSRLYQPSASLDCRREWIHTSAAWRISESAQKIIFLQISIVIFL